MQNNKLFQVVDTIAYTRLRIIIGNTRSRCFAYPTLMNDPFNIVINFNNQMSLQYTTLKNSREQTKVQLKVECLQKTQRTKCIIIKQRSSLDVTTGHNASTYKTFKFSWPLFSHRSLFF